jgi:hypothetical protein
LEDKNAPDRAVLRTNLRFAQTSGSQTRYPPFLRRNVNMKIHTQLSKAKRLFARRDFSAAEQAINNLPILDPKDRFLQQANLWFIALAQGDSDRAAVLADEIVRRAHMLREIRHEAVLFYDPTADGAPVLESEEIDAIRRAVPHK